REKKPATKPPLIAHRLPPFHDRPVPSPAPERAPSAPVEIATAPPPAEPTPVEPPAIEPAATEPAPVPVVSNPAEEVKTLEPPQPNTVTMAAGTLFAVRIGEALSTKKNRPGDSFTGTLDHEVDVEGFVIAEKGARVEGRVSMVEEAGRMRGLSHLGIELTRIHTSDGQTVTIRTAEFEKLGPQSRREDAEKVGAGTVLGAVIGAAAGGGKGAAIGAGAGAAAGAGTVAATPGRPAEIPVETVVTFKLDQPVTLTEKLQQ
ncbi:MAG TPA: hypothetical protein VK419_10895, partial [Bryobacteraceae bacterium]|nr:hypothetical protein [Bryobacteraceae bacterium]